jgi:hypothetical protein
MNKKVKALLMTLKDLLECFMIAVCLCFGFGNKVPTWLAIIAMVYCLVKFISFFYKEHLREL